MNLKEYNSYLNNFVSYLTNNKRYSFYTITSYKKDIYEYLEFLKKNNIDIKNSNYKIVEEYSKYLYKKKLSKRSIARKYSSIRTFYNYLEKKNVLEEIRNKPYSVLILDVAIFIYFSTNTFSTFIWILENRPCRQNRFAALVMASPGISTTSPTDRPEYPMTI